MGDMEDIAAQDQAAARERDFERRVQKMAAWWLAFGLIIGIYCTLAVWGIVPAAPWSPLGKQ